MGKIIDLTGRRFGRLVVLGIAGRTTGKHKEILWACKCDCGNSASVNGQRLRNGETTSCGCYHRERVHEMSKTHGETKSRLYSIWKAMKRRCYGVNTKVYYRYGGRGITVCDEWRNDFVAFKTWALATGYQDGLTLDRIDNDKGYSPENCRWASYKEQANNTRRNHLVTCRGETHTIAEWAVMRGINDQTLRNRLGRYGWSVERALNFTTNGG